MNTKNMIKVFGLALLSGSFVACDLDREPKQALDQSVALKTYTDAQAWEAGIKAGLRARLGRLYIVPQDVQVDDLSATLEYGNNYGAQANWDIFQAQNYDTRDVYAYSYMQIKNINFVIEKLPGVLSSFTAKEQTSAKLILGGAYFARAYHYLNLALRYGKAYDSSTAATDLSVPLLLVYDVKAKPPRATNQAVYAQILADITQAETLLASKAGAANSSAITIDAVKALKARVALYMKDYTTAYNESSALTSSSTYALMTAGSANMVDMWQGDGLTLKESILLPPVSYPAESNHDEKGELVTGVYMAANAKAVKFSPLYIPTKTLYDLYTTADTRKGVYFLAGATVAISGLDYTDLVIVNKWRGNPSLAATKHATWGTVPDGRMRPKLFRIAEQYLIQAEAAYQTSQDAHTPLNALRASRGLSAIPSTTTGPALLAEIKAERRRELAFEGFRLFDLKRWGEDMVRNNPQTSTAGTPVVPDLATKTYTAGHNKFVWPIPDQDRQVGGLVQNPGY